jgi:mono/diheme cytochrome c family protein
MSRRVRNALLAALCLASGAALVACGENSVDVAEEGQIERGATLFNERCAGCHTLDAAGAEGSNANIRTRERTDGPNFNQRQESTETVLYAIRNGGFSGAIMPQNIVVGEDAAAVAAFVAKYSGQEAEEE